MLSYNQQAEEDTERIEAECKAADEDDCYLSDDAREQKRFRTAIFPRLIFICLDHSDELAEDVGARAYAWETLFLGYGTNTCLVAIREIRSPDSDDSSELSDSEQSE
jgi:hypothetical protein